MRIKSRFYNTINKVLSLYSTPINTGFRASFMPKKATFQPKVGFVKCVNPAFMRFNRIRRGVENRLSGVTGCERSSRFHWRLGLVKPIGSQESIYQTNQLPCCQRQRSFVLALCNFSILLLVVCSIRRVVFPQGVCRFHQV